MQRLIQFRWLKGEITSTDLEIRTILENLQYFLECVNTNEKTEEFLRTHPEFKDALEKYEVKR